MSPGSDTASALALLFALVPGVVRGVWAWWWPVSFERCWAGPSRRRSWRRWATRNWETLARECGLSVQRSNRARTWAVAPRHGRAMVSAVLDRADLGAPAAGRRDHRRGGAGPDHPDPGRSDRRGPGEGRPRPGRRGGGDLGPLPGADPLHGGAVAGDARAPRRPAHRATARTGGGGPGRDRAAAGRHPLDADGDRAAHPGRRLLRRRARARSSGASAPAWPPPSGPGWSGCGGWTSSAASRSAWAHRCSPPSPPPPPTRSP